MTEPELPESLSEEPKAVAAPEPETVEPEPEPEPWTPARVTEWNAYYDLYVALGVLVLAFVVSANKITHSSIWTWLQAGRTMASQGRPLVTDLFSFTEEGRRWVNIPWLFEWSHALIYDGVYDAAPADPADPVVSNARREQIAAATLVALTALARLATVLVLLRIRRPGPGLWWSAVCATIALGAIVGPPGTVLGGIAGTAMVAPGTWGALLLAVELLLWHRTVVDGRRGAALGLIPLFLVWANLDETFVIGLLILAAGVLGRIRSGAPKEANPLSLPRGLAILGACSAVCLVNPSFYRIFPAALSSLAPPFRLSVFGSALRAQGQVGNSATIIAILYLVIVGLGFGSFVLNRRRFEPSRFLMYTVAALFWGAYIPYRASFAVVFAACLALNGQEWYHDRFGTEGRLGRGWALWSVGGRAVTIILIFTFVGLALTGWGKSPGDPLFGFGFDPDAFAFEMAEYLRTAPLQGRVLNTTPAQGDALIWRTSDAATSRPRRPTFIDSRQGLFSAATVDQLQRTRQALSKDDVAAWEPILDKYGISAVIIDGESPKTYEVLLRSSKWIPFYDDGRAVLFGRADAPAADLAYFQSHKLSAEALAYHQSRTVPPPDRPPTPMTSIDRVFRNRSLLEPQPHTTAALHWLQGQGDDNRSETGELADPAHCFLAIQEARIALARRPDDTGAYRILAEAYRVLMLEESALLGGLALSPENATAIVQIEPRTNLLMNRFRQRLTALNSAIQTTPFPQSDPEREALFALNNQAFVLHLSVNHLDLARDRLQAMLDELPERLRNDADARAALDRQIAELSGRIVQIQDQINDLTLEQQLGPLQRAGVALGEGAPGLALLELEEAERTGISPALVRPQLVDLYCDTGQPEKALELLASGNVEDPSLGTEAGVSAMRQARVYFLVGNYEYSARLWEGHAISQLGYERGGRALAAGSTFLRGEVKAATTMFLELPGKIGLQASWEYDLGLCRLESGKPDLAAEPLTRALTLAPDLAVRPIAAYYLEKLGKPVPPPAVTTPPDDTGQEPAAEKPAGP